MRARALKTKITYLWQGVRYRATFAGALTRDNAVCRLVSEYKRHVKPRDVLQIEIF